MKTKHYHIHSNDNHFSLNDRVEIKWVEILVYPGAIFLFLFMVTGYFAVAIPVALFVGLSYLIFRYFAWFLYSELKIDKSNNSLVLSKYFINKELSSVNLDSDFRLEKLKFNALRRSGKLKYLLVYETHKANEIMVVKNEEYKNAIEEELSSLK